MPSNVVRNPKQEELWNKAKRIANKQGRAGDYPYIMGIFKQMGGLEKSAPPDIRKLGQERLWDIAKRKARQAGRERDFDYVLKLYQQMAGWIGVQKSLDLPAIAGVRHLRLPGQIPDRDRNAAEAHRLATQKPRPFSVARLHEVGHVLTNEVIVNDLGFDAGKRSEWISYLNQVIPSAQDEVSLRKNIVSKCQSEKLDSIVRNMILKRSLKRWRTKEKSMYVQIYTPDELLEKAEARGGTYHRRVPRKGGGYTYYYDEDKYRSSKQAHTNGEEASKAYITGRVNSRVGSAGEGGCGPEVFQDLVKKYGAKAVAKCIRESGTVGFHKGKFFLQKKEGKIAGDKPPEKDNGADSNGQKARKSEFFYILAGKEELSKAVAHKYVSRKRDAKGNWVYEYPEDRKKRIVDMILDWLSNPKRSLTVGSTARSFRVDKIMAGQILQDLEQKGKIRKEGANYVGEGAPEPKKKPEAAKPAPKSFMRLSTESNLEQIRKVAVELAQQAFRDKLPGNPKENPNFEMVKEALGGRGTRVVQFMRDYMAAWNNADERDSAMLVNEGLVIKFSKHANEIGQAAFKAGRPRDPYDNDAIRMMARNTEGGAATQDASVLAIATGFKEGWDRAKQEAEAKEKLEKPRMIIPSEKAKMKVVPGEQLSLFERPVKPEPMVLPMVDNRVDPDGGEEKHKEGTEQISTQADEKMAPVMEKPKEKEPTPKTGKPTEIATATVEKEVTEERAEKEETADELAVGVVTSARLRELKDRGLEVVIKKRSGEKTDAEWEAIGILTGRKFDQLVDRGLTVEWAKGAIPKAESPKNEMRKDKTTSDRLEQTGDHIWGSRKDLAGIGQITDSKQLEGMSYDDAAYIVRKSRLVPVHNLETLKAMNMTPGTAHMTIALLASIKAKPGDSAAERAVYVDEIREVTGGIDNVKTVEDFNNFLNELSAKRRSAPQWEIIEEVKDRDVARERIAELEKDNPGIRYGTRFSYHTYKTEIAKKVAKPYDALGARFTKFAERSGKFYNSAYNEAMTADNLWTYNKDAKVVDGWAYLEAADAEKKAAKKKKAEKSKSKRGETKRGWSGAKEIAGEVIREGGNIEVKEANAERTRDTFNFREVDYGKKGYMTQADREYHTKSLEEAMHDFSEILGTTPDTLSFNGRLGVAMGARGRGKASAHYEPIRKVINITKFRGGGNIAHEWGHALDNIIAGHFVKTGRGSSKGDAFLSEVPDHGEIPKEISTAMVRVMDVIKKHPDPDKARADHKKYVDDLKQKADSLVSQNNALVAEHKELRNKPQSRESANKRIEGMERRIGEWQDYIDKEKPKIQARKDKGQKVSFDREMEIHHRENWIKQFKDQIAELKKPESVRTKEDTARMARIEEEIEDLRLPINRSRTRLNMVAKMDPTASDYYKSAMLLGKDYWGNNQELFARAFESYVQDEIASKDRRNTYLVDGTTVTYNTDIPVSMTGTVQPYPKGAERDRINAAMKKLVETIRDTKALEKSLQKLYILR